MAAAVFVVVFAWNEYIFALVFTTRDAKTTPLVISKIGFGADIYDFAHRHGAAYGVIAVLVALFAGWMAHLAFRRR